MKKIYSLLAGALMLFAQSASAQTMSDENAVLQGEKYNMRLFKNYDFVQGTYNGNAFTNDAGETVSGDGCLTLSPDKASFTLNAFDAFQVTSPVEMTNFYIQIGTGAINLRAGVNKDGLHNYGSGGRWAAIADMKAGQIIAIEHSEGTNDGKGNETTVKPNVMQNNGASGWADVPTDPLQVEDITAEIHDIQDLVDADGDGEPDMAHDTHHYWKVINDGFVYIDFERNTHVKALQIWINAEAAEAVSSPTMKMASVNGTSRGIDFKPGESTLGNTCTSYYITERDKAEDGLEYPLYLKKTEEIDHYDYTFNIDPETGDTISVDSAAVYKLALDEDKIAEYGFAGEHEYDGTSLKVDNDDDADGDGYVTIWAQTLSESKAFSDIVELKVNVGEITLNTPTLTLVQVDGVNRTYKIGWSNNTLCGEDFTISGSQDGNEFHFDPNTGIGESITFSESAIVKVEVNGYTTGELNQAADFQGLDVKRKNESEGHDWDFVNISAEMRAQFYAEVPDYYVETVIDAEKGDTAFVNHTVEEYNKAIEEAVEGVDAWEMKPKYYGWWQTVASNRTTLDVVSDTIYEGEIFDKNANGYGYVKEQTGIFDGLQISCPPNDKNASCIFKYLDKADGNELGFLGVYFMARPTITFPREVAKAGELVEVYYGQGGSNYTNTTTHALHTVPTDGLLSITLPSGGVHVFYIDVYTYDNLPEDIYETGVEATDADSKIVEIYTISGARVNALQKGINIVKMSNGKIAKMLVK